MVIGTAKTAERQLRAYATIPNVVIKNGQNWPFIYISVKNFGQTPAKKCSYWVNLSENECPLKTTLEKKISTKNCAVGVIAPGDTFTIRVEVPQLSYGAEIDSGHYGLYVYGEFSYDDVFDCKQFTYFRFMRNGKECTNEGEMEICEEGNEAT